MNVMKNASHSSDGIGKLFDGKLPGFNMEGELNIHETRRPIRGSNVGMTDATAISDISLSVQTNLEATKQAFRQHARIDRSRLVLVVGYSPKLGADHG